MIRNIAIVSLSSGIIGEPGVHFEIEIGLQRLKEYGLNVKFMPHALKGLEYVKAHPEKRARDLLEAFRDPEVDMILCAIGGDDTYRLLQGPSVFSGKILGGCIDTIYDCFNGDRYADMPALCGRSDPASGIQRRKADTGEIPPCAFISEGSRRL